MNIPHATHPEQAAMFDIDDTLNISHYRVIVQGSVFRV